MLNLGTYFNLLALLYMVLGLAIAHLNMEHHAMDNLEQIGWISVGAMGGFNFAYWLVGLRQPHWSNSELGYLPSHKTMLFVVGMALFFGAVAILLSGPLDFLLSDRVIRFNFFQQHKPLFYVANFINICLPIVFLRYLAFKHKRDRNLLYFIIAYGLVYGLATISRYDISIILLCSIYFIDRFKIIRPSLVISMILISLLITFFFKPSLYQIMLGETYPHNIDFGEYYNWIRHTIMLMDKPYVDLPHNGYWLTLKSLFIISPEENTLSEWFFEEFFWERKVLYPGLGYGFSGIWEGYSENGVAGVAMHFAVVGACFGWLERSSSAMRQVFTVFALILSYRLFRSESYNFVKVYAWYFLYPTFAIMLVDKFLIWITRRNFPVTPDRLHSESQKGNSENIQN